MFHSFLIPSVIRLRITKEFQSCSVTYDYTLSYQKSSQHLKPQCNKVVTTKYLAKFQSPRAITRPKIIGHNYFISELRTWVTLYVPATQWRGHKNPYFDEQCCDLSLQLCSSDLIFQEMMKTLYLLHYFCLKICGPKHTEQLPIVKLGIT